MVDGLNHNFQDERLLHRQALILYERNDMTRFLPVVRALLAPHFYDVLRMSKQDQKISGLID